MKTTSLELSQRLKALGVPQVSIFVYRHWRGNGQVITDIKKDKFFDYPKSRGIPPSTSFICSSYSSDELGEWLPMKIDEKDNSDLLRLAIMHGDEKHIWHVSYVGYDYEPYFIKSADTLAEAMGLMLEYLIINGYIKVEELK